MVNKIRKIVYFFMKFQIFRILVQPFISLGNLFRKEKIRYFADQKKFLEIKIFNEYLDGKLEIQFGPFKGLKYPALKSITSSLIPKFIGTYESEIYEDLELFLKTNSYDIIIDIGAADGYYAAGLAMRSPQTQVIGYDANPASIKFCEEMKQINKLNNLDMRGVFLESSMNDFADKRVLLICDIDGFEYDLFSNSDFLECIKNFDIIVETHDYVNPQITTIIPKALKSTHNFKIIPFKPNKLTELPKELFSRASFAEKKFAVHERIVDNKWIVARAKKHHK